MKKPRLVCTRQGSYHLQSAHLRRIGPFAWTFHTDFEQKRPNLMYYSHAGHGEAIEFGISYAGDGAGTFNFRDGESKEGFSIYEIQTPYIPWPFRGKYGVWRFLHTYDKWGPSIAFWWDSGLFSGFVRQNFAPAAISPRKEGE